MKLVITAKDPEVQKLDKNYPPGISVKCLAAEESTHALPPEVNAVFTVIVDWAQPIAQGLIAAWLYDKMKTLKGEITINGKVCKDKNEINETIKIIEEDDE